MRRNHLTLYGDLPLPKKGVGSAENQRQVPFYSITSYIENVTLLLEDVKPSIRPNVTRIRGGQLGPRRGGLFPPTPIPDKDPTTTLIY